MYITACILLVQLWVDICHSCCPYYLPIHLALPLVLVFLIILFPSSFSHPYSFLMVKLSLLLWDKDESQLQAGTSFTPTLTGHIRTSVPSMSIFHHLKLQDSAASQMQAPNYHPLIVLCLSSLSFLDSVIHGGSSDNPLYVIHTVDNMAKVHRSNPKGFINISCVTT